MCGTNFCVLFLIRFRYFWSFPFSFDQTMVSIRVQPLYSMASSQSHDHICQKAFSISLFCVWTFQSVKEKNGRDVTRMSHTSRLSPGFTRSLKLCKECGFNSCVRVFFIPMGSRGLKQWVVTSISHMGEILDSDWSRSNLLRSDWLLLIVASMTTNWPLKNTHWA